MSPEQLATLLDIIQAQFVMNWHGIHGISHWRRVEENGRRVAEQTGANLTVVQLFAYLHDSRRFSDGHDPQHGRRAAEFIQSLNGTTLELPPGELELLVYACRYHTDGLTEGDITVQTCWDADRLDLGRVGIRPQPRYLCTAPAKDPALIEWAYERSRTW
jgi:uncharacterized protein